MSPRAALPVARPARFPRVSGDEPVIAGPTTLITRFSPRERG